MKRIIETTSAPKPVGAYSQAVALCKLVFASGQIAVDPATSELISGDIKAQTKQVLKNLLAVIDEAGSSKEDILKVNIFLKNMDDFAQVNEIYAEFFKGCDYPARSCVEVARLPKDALIEIEAVAAAK